MNIDRGVPAPDAGLFGLADLSELMGFYEDEAGVPCARFDLLGQPGDQRPQAWPEEGPEGEDFWLRFIEQRPQGLFVRWADKDTLPALRFLGLIVWDEFDALTGDAEGRSRIEGTALLPKYFTPQQLMAVGGGALGVLDRVVVLNDGAAMQRLERRRPRAAMLAKALLALLVHPSVQAAGADQLAKDEVPSMPMPAQSGPDNLSVQGQPATDTPPVRIVYITRKQLIARHESVWRRIKAHLSNASTNGLADAAKGQFRCWNEQAALQWARERDYLQKLPLASSRDTLESCSKAASPVQSRVHRIKD